jgi:hypothetical protein
MRTRFRTIPDIANELYVVTASLIQLDALFSQLEYQSIAVAQLIRDETLSEDPCPPKTVADELYAQLAPGHALVFLWGNLFEDEESFFIQSFVEVMRGSQRGDLDFSWPSSDKDYEFSAGLPFTRAAFPPREVPRSVVEELSGAYEKLTAVHIQPNASSLEVIK